MLSGLFFVIVNHCKIMPVKVVPETINFPDEEAKVLEHWKKIDAFQSTLKQSKNRPR